MALGQKRAYSDCISGFPLLGCHVYLLHSCRWYKQNFLNTLLSSAFEAKMTNNLKKSYTSQSIIDQCCGLVHGGNLWVFSAQQSSSSLGHTLPISNSKIMLSSSVIFHTGKTFLNSSLNSFK